MINTVYIDSEKQVISLIFNQNYDSNIQRYRSTFLYRGMPNKNYTLKTSLQRNCKASQDSFQSTSSKLIKNTVTIIIL